MIRSPLILLSFIALLSVTRMQSQDSEKDKPNFIFIISDDQSFNTIQALGNNEISTPHLDQLVKEGINFSHCFNQGSWSGAVCVASRTMLITGQTVFNAPKNKSYLNKWAQDQDKDETEVKLWPEVFGDAGYLTFMTGKWHNTDHAVLKGFDQAKGIGWGMYETFDQNNSKQLAYGRPKQTSWSPSNKAYKGHWSPKVKDIIYDEKGTKKISANYVVSQHTSSFYGDNAVNFIMNEARHSSKPFFAFVAFNAPHDPRQSPKEFIDMYPTNGISVPENFLPEHPFDQGDHRVRDELLAPFPRTEQAVKLHRQEYYAIISHMDKEVGRIMKALKESGQANNTYVIFTSDHGLAVGSHGLMGKQSQYDHSVRMPFILKGPGIEKGKEIDEMIYMQSAFATTCELAGLSVPETVEFPSIVNLIKGDQAKANKYVFGAYKDLQRMIRSDQFKLIIYPKADEVQLFDLKVDPDETTNLAYNKKYNSIKKKLFKELVKQQASLGDFLELKER